MKKENIGVYIFLAIWLLMMFSPCLMGIGATIVEAQGNPFDYARITDVDYTAVVMDEEYSGGSIYVRERLTFDIHAASRDNGFWELWRDLCEDEQEGLKIDYQVLSVKQIMPDGSEVIYEESPRLYWEDEDYLSSNPVYGPGKWYHSEGPYNESARQYECVFFYVDNLYREEVVFEIEYIMNNASFRYNDCSELYLCMYSEDTVNHLESFKAQIAFPDKDMPAEGNYWVTTYGTDNDSFPVTLSTTLHPGYHTFCIDLDKDDLNFHSYNEYIEFDLVSHGEDRHIFTENAPDNIYSDWDALEEIREEQEDYYRTPQMFKLLKIGIFLVFLTISIIIGVYAFTVNKRTKKKYNFYEPTYEPEFFRDIPSDLDPNFAASLVFSKEKAPKDDSGVYSAILLSLARKEYIDLHDAGQGDVLITINHRPKPIAPPIQTTPVQTMAASSVATSLQTATDSPLQTTVTSPLQTEAPASVTTSMFGDAPVTSGLGDIPAASVLGATPEATAAPVAPVIPEKVYEPLTLCEAYYFNLILRHTVAGNTMLMSSFQSRVSYDYEDTAAFAKSMKNSIVNIGIKEGYLQKADYKQPQSEIRFSAGLLKGLGIFVGIVFNLLFSFTRINLAYGAFFIFAIVCIAGSSYMKKQSTKYVLLTQFGEDEYAKWRGLYRFLDSETLINERTVVELPLWERYLVYATAFGISEKVIKAINLRCPEVTTSSMLNSSYCRSGRIRHTGRSFRSAVHSGSHGGGFGGGFGGGYGGGGRGGGGGGGGH